jgi:hypothetical protein
MKWLLASDPGYRISESNFPADALATLPHPQFEALLV